MSKSNKCTPDESGSKPSTLRSASRRNVMKGLAVTAIAGGLRRDALADSAQVPVDRTYPAIAPAQRRGGAAGQELPSAHLYSGEAAKGATPLAGQSRAAGGVPEPAASAGRVWQELTQTARGVGGTLLCPLLRHRRDSAHASAGTQVRHVRYFRALTIASVNLASILHGASEAIRQELNVMLLFRHDVEITSF